MHTYANSAYMQNLHKCANLSMCRGSSQSSRQEQILITNVSINYDVC